MKVIIINDKNHQHIYIHRMETCKFDSCMLVSITAPKFMICAYVCIFLCPNKIFAVNDFAITLEVDVIFLDLSKVFDTALLKRLCNKLSFYDIREALLRLSECFRTELG